MEMKNAFKTLVNVTENKWYEFADLALVFGFHIKMSGIEWRTNKELTEIMIACHQVGFLDVHISNPELVKIADVWYDFKTA